MTSSFRGYDQFRNSLFLGTKEGEGRGGKGRKRKGRRFITMGGRRRGQVREAPSAPVSRDSRVLRVTALLALLALVFSYLGGVTEDFILLLL